MNARVVACVCALHFFPSVSHIIKLILYTYNMRECIPAYTHDIIILRIIVLKKRNKITYTVI